MYGKLFASTFTGSMVGAGADVFAVWGYVIANTCDSQVELNPKLLAVAIGITQEAVQKAIEYLCAPDPSSRNPEHDGRRLVLERGYAYFVPSHETYRAIRDEDERRDYMRNYMRQRRKSTPADSQNVKSVNSGKLVLTPVNSGKPQLANTEAEADTDVIRSDVENANSRSIESEKRTAGDTEWGVVTPEGGTTVVPVVEVDHTRVSALPSKTSLSVANSDPVCPECGAAMWNQKTSKKVPWKSGQPIYKCKKHREGCKGVIWEATSTAPTTAPASEPAVIQEPEPDYMKLMLEMR